MTHATLFRIVSSFFGGYEVRKTAIYSTLALVAALLAAGCGGAEGESFVLIAEAQKEAAAKGVPVLLDFYTDW